MKEAQRSKRRRRSKLPQRYRHMLRTSLSPLETVSGLRLMMPLPLYPRLVDWLLTFGARAHQFQAGRKPQSLAHLRSSKLVLQGVSLEAELAWTIAYLKHEAAIINRFVVVRQDFQDTLLKGSGITCIKTLDQIDGAFGNSLWSLEQRIGLLAMSEGLESQKSFVQHLRQVSNSATVRFFAAMWSVRNEMATHFDTFKRELVSRMPEWTESKPFASYALFHCVDHWQPSAHSIANTLRWELNNSTVDIYEVFLRLAQRAISTKASTAKILQDAVRDLSSVVRDARLSMLLFVAGGDPEMLSTLRRVHTPFANQWYRSAEHTRAPLADTVASVEDLVAQAMSIAELNLDYKKEADLNLQYRLVSLLANVARKGPRFEESRADLLHVYTNLTSLDIAECIHLAAREQVAPEPPEVSWLGQEAYCRAAKLHPGLLQYLPQEMKGAYLGALLGERESGAVVSAERIRAGLSDEPSSCDLKPMLIRECSAQAAFQAGRFEFVIALAQEASEGHSPSIRSLARLVASALIRSTKIQGSIRFIVGRALSDPDGVPMLPIAACYDAIGEDINLEMAADLSLPIIVDLQSRHISEKNTVLRYRYEDFLTSQGCTRPSELIQKVAELPRDPLIYFLRQVCIPRVMQLSLEFPTSRAVSDERLAVCVLLRSLDPNNATVYEAEILEITRQQGISQGVQAVEQSKIWIDQEPIRRWADKHLHEGFKRLIDLQAAGILSEIDVDEEQLEPINAEQIAKALEVPELPTDEAGTLLKRLVSQFLAHCFVSKPHGLDSFLSIRVRHGVLAGQMRAAPEAEKIITLQREAGSGEYFPSEYWLAKFTLGDPEVAFKVDTRLQRFSRDFDGLIDRFVRDHFQIKGEDKPLGLFHFGYLPTDLLVLQADLHQASSFDVFIDRCFQLFWNSVDASLEQIRKHIDRQLQTDLNSLFVQLINDLEAITAEQPHPELGYALRNAHTRATNALEQVKEWFRPARPRASTTATFQELLDISLQVVRNMDALFHPRLQVTTKDMPLFFQLQKFTDIFIILFDNVRRHCGVGAAPAVIIEASLMGAVLNIQVTNDVSSDVINSVNIKKLETIREKIEQGLFQRAVSTEGGTGLLKIRNILSGETPDASLIEFGFEDAFFRVKLRIPSLVMAVGGSNEQITAS